MHVYTSGCKCERVHLFGNHVYRPGLVCRSVCVSVSVCVCRAFVREHM